MTKIQSPAPPEKLGVPPKRQFFMSAHDMRFWIQSAKADAELSRLEKEHGTQKAFDILYKMHGDPWGYLVPNYRYQTLKYYKMLGMLTEARYESVLDVGCGIGVFTRMLAPHIDRGLGLELSSAAVERARELSASEPHLRFEQSDIFDIGKRDSEQFDLIVLADVLYYLSPLPDETLHQIMEMVMGLLAPQGTILLANHFFFDVDPQSRQVRRIHAAFQNRADLTLVKEERHPFFLSSVLRRVN